MFNIAAGTSIFVSLGTLVLLCVLKITGSTRLSKKKSDNSMKYSTLKDEEEAERYPIRKHTNSYVAEI